ncbi:TPA: type II toxin-antitoxin system HipA family toxin [Pseudomonas aeruginosa]|uniref:type II toxin-antitoxin system HipA family toxin n=1 Tax=Pseudomonas aeruginosa TaxID=287 RepID=UPI000EAD8975|nr:type II toxin-antitoxin system HipA family toxin [Pseudomonas aeruginosa]EKV3033167.1 type II toxin-antitoxin system HipA family toxin [Pseudomonas aeruginosa]EKV3075347.1 type II toxin-antitoxin system HipA family toxin [Pseudomonas aeruginosa]RUE28707.1 type II toxin-antitoxin system HipA family toxin [Pseudomonas aeruginosa]HBO0987406.1 type II toxin-antitoxin system HipA family toxin [Pseudomonas aeruginosa]HCF2456899.1 type II toxin-antitoxin system HipA family toxin [Pseudomonas aerug
MPEVKVFYEGWGERWHWGTLVSTTALTGRPLIVFEYSSEARQRGLELSSYTLPLEGSSLLRREFPDHQLGLPGPVYDALPDGWGMLLMDRMFRQRGLSIARIGALERLTFIGSNAMGAMTFEPVAPEGQAADVHIPLEQLAADVQEVLHGEGGEFLQTLLLVGGSPQGARPKALVYRDPSSGGFTTAVTPGFEAWLVKFPAAEEHAEVCAIEMVYAECLRRCGIETPDTEYFRLPNGLAAFASKRFDRQGGLRIPMQSLAAFTGANYRTPGVLDYVNFLRATHMCTNDVREMAVAFERAVFNVAFNNRDDHPKNFAYIMSQDGHWKLAPAYDVTYCEGPGGYHQMDVMGEAMAISRHQLLRLATEAEVSQEVAGSTVDGICEVASRFSAIADDLYPGVIARDTVRTIQNNIDKNVARLRQVHAGHR